MSFCAFALNIVASVAANIVFWLAGGILVYKWLGIRLSRLRRFFGIDNSVIVHVLMWDFLSMEGQDDYSFTRAHP
jgi:hypothetical protein